MRELNPKWIVEDGRIIVGKCVYHKDLSELLPCGEVDEKTLIERISGGGWFKYNSDDESFLFYGLSTDFGQCTLDQVKEAYKLGVHAQYYDHRYDDMIIKFSTQLKMADALNDFVILTK